jgi:branched-chain amino acid transport system substrate-binding protein
MAAHQLLDIRKVSALLPIWSEDAEVLSPIAEKYDRIVMTLGAGGPRAARFSTSTFRATTSDGDLAKGNVRDELALGSKNGCILVSDSSYYVDIAKDIAEAWTAGGGNIVFRESIPYVPTEVRSVVTKLRSVSCDSIFVWAAPAGLGPVLKELKFQELSGHRILPWWGTAGDVLNATVGDHSSFTLNRYVLRDENFIAVYNKRFGEAPMRPAGNCYDGIRVLAQVMNKVGTSREKVREALLSLNDYVGVTGPFKIRPDREREGEFVEKVSIVDGKVQP